MGSTASTSETERERGKEKEMLPYHFPAWCCNSCFVFFFNVSFLTILVMILMLAVLDVPRNALPPLEKKKSTHITTATGMNLGRIRTGKNGRSEEAREVCCGHLGMSGKGQNEGTLREGKRESVLEKTPCGDLPYTPLAMLPAPCRFCLQTWPFTC